MNEVVALLAVLRASPLREAPRGPAPLADACLYAAATEAVLMLEAATGSIIEANPAAARLLCVPRTRLLGASLLQSFDGGAALALTRAINLVRREGTAQVLTARTRDGRSEVQLALSLVRVGPESYVLARLGQPAPDRRTDGDGVTTSVVLDLIGEASEGFVVTDPELHVLYANQAFAELAGIDSPQQALGHSLVRWLELTQADLTALAVQRARREAVTVHETRLRATSGKTQGVELWAVAVADGEQPCWGFRLHSV